MLAVLLVAGVGVGAWAYATGRFGVGPLSGRDKEAVTAIAEGAEGPAWASAGDLECAADELVHDVRSADLGKRGLLEPQGDGWTYTGEWRLEDARSFVEAGLECSDDWADDVGSEWGLDDTDCLDEIDRSVIADYFVAESFSLSDDEEGAKKGREEAVTELDECYADDPPAPEAKSKPGYRSVTFMFEEPDSEGGDVVLRVKDDGDWTPLDGGRHKVDTRSGGKKGCVEARVETTYPWGTTRTADDRFCGKSEPPRIWWERAKRCTHSPGCTSWELHYEGLAPFDTGNVRLVENGGDCNSESGRCSHTFFVGPEGRGTAVTWSVYRGYDEHFLARVGRMTATLPD